MPLNLRSLAMVSLYSWLAACAATPESPVNQFFDERTGATVTIVHEPLTFALERSTLAAHARDYVSLSALEIDRSGEPQLYFLGYFWSTIDRRTRAAAARAADKSLVLFADGRRIRLTPIAPLPKDLEANRQMLAPETSNFEEAAYQVPLETLRYISNCRILSLRLGGDEDDEDAEAETYEIWSDSRNSLKNFVASIGPSG